MNKIFDFNCLFDSHSHFNVIEADKSELVNEALKVGVEKIVDVGNDIKSSQNALQNASLFLGIILPTAGIHPEWLVPGSDLFLKERNELSIDTEILKLKSLVSENLGKFYMIGETGLDYYWLEKNPELSRLDKEKSISLQKILFEEQLKIAIEFDLPVTIHSRNSHRDCMEIVSKYSEKLKGIFHSFTGNIDEAKEILSLGFPIGINGIITYRSAQAFRDTFIELTKDTKITSPKDLYNLGIYLETDSPFLIPSNVQDRKKYNSPQSIKFIWEFVYNLLNQ